MRGMAAATKELIDYARRLLAEDHPQTLRQLHYAIFSRREIKYENTEADYKRLSRNTTTARRAYREVELEVGAEAAGRNRLHIPAAWMVDETRQAEMVNVFQDSAEYIEVVRGAYRRDNWQDQPSHCEVWSEKATILGAIRPVAARLGITLRVCHGFASTGMETDVGGVFEGIRKPVVVFFLGDHDPSGHCIERDIHRRAQIASGRVIEMKRLAIHSQDIAKFNLPPQMIKKKDSRAKSFRAKFGANAATVELDALPAVELRQRVEEAVTALIDFEKWNRQVSVQELELRCIQDFADRVKNLPQMEAGR